MSTRGTSFDGDGDGRPRSDGDGGLDGHALDGRGAIDGAARAALPDPHGQAALLLLESLIHELVERSILPLSGAIDVIESAASVQREFVDQEEPGDGPMRKALSLLNAITVSLSGVAAD